MRSFLAFVIMIVFLAASALAHEVSGTVEVLLKGDKKKSELDSVLIYLDEVKPAAPALAKKEFMMATKDKQFTPRLMAVPVGATVNFPNFDPIFHNLFSVSNPNQFDLGLYKGGGESKTKTFQSPGIVRVFCNVHPQMTATIVVANSPYFVVADKSGKFNLGDIPIGTYILHAYSEEGQGEQKIEVGQNAVNVKLSVDGRNFKKIKHKNKFGKDYNTDENERY